MKTINALCLSLILAGAAGAQTNEAAKEPPKSLTTLKVQLNLANTLGDKKLSNLVYTLFVNANGPRTKMRMGIEVPVTLRGEQKATQYRTVGTNIDCEAFTTGDGRYNLHLALDRSSLFPDKSADTSSSAPAMSELPLFRSFMSDVSLILRDGETGEYVAATDPVTGEVLKVSATLTVLK